MKYFDIPEEEFETLCGINIDELGLSVRAYNVLRRAGCETLADAAYLSVEEVQNLRNIGKRVFTEVLEKMEEHNISLMTQEEKQQFLRETENTKILNRKIKRLEGKLKVCHEKIQDYEKQRAQAWKKEWEEEKESSEYKERELQEVRERENREQKLQEAREIVRTSSYPIAGILQGMYWGNGVKGGIRFCEIFELRQKQCFVRDDAQENRELEFSCEECIETFLAEYYWKQKIEARQKKEYSEAPKMMRMRTWGKELIGRCPVCKQRHSYEKYTYYCSQCGTFLNWDEENWEEETKEYYDLLYCDEEDDEIEDA